MVACVIATLAIMWMHMPHGYWALISILIVSLPDAGASLVRGAQRLIATLVGAVVALFIMTAFVQQPWFEIVALGIVCGFGLFLSRASAAPYVGILVSVTPALLVGLAGGEPSLGVLDGVWRGLAVGLGVIIGTACQLWVLPDDPEHLLRADLARTLAAVEAELSRLAGGGRPAAAAPDLRDRAFEALGRQLEWLANAEALHRTLRARHAEQLSLIGSAQRLATATLSLGELMVDTPGAGAPSAEERARIDAVTQRTGRLRAALEERPLPAAAPPATASAGPGFADFAILEIEQTLDDMEAAARFLGASTEASARGPAVASPVDRSERPFFLTPAFSIRNAPALRYGFKGGLAAALAFVAVQALHAPGIGTAVVTCVLVAQSSFGAMVRKAGLRLLGAMIGGLLGILTIVFAMPQMDTIASLLVVTAVVCGISGWVLAGSIRISYAGIQIGLAWVLTVLIAFGPSTDLASPLDRVIGILLGILITFVVFSTVWPELASDGLRSSLVSALRNMGQLSRVAISEDDKAALSRPSGGFRFQVTHDFLDALRFATESRLEPQARSDLGRAAQDALVGVLDASQSAFIALHAVVRRRLDAGVFPGSSVDAALLALAKDVKPFLESVALRIETGREAPAPDLEGALARISEVGEGAPEEPALPELRVRLLIYGNLVTKLRRLEARSREFAERDQVLAGRHRGDSREELPRSRAERADGHGAGGVG